MANPRQLVLTLLFALSEAALLMAFLGMVAPPNWLWIGYAVVLGLLLVIAFGWQWLADRVLAPQIQIMAQGVGFVGLWASILILLITSVGVQSLGFISGLGSLLITLLLWWRGITLGQLAPTPHNVRNRIVIAICVLALLGFFNIVARSADLGLLTLVAFSALVMALPLAHLNSIAHSPIGRSIPSLRDYWRWVGPNLLLGGAACLLAVIVLNQTFARQVIGFVLAAIFGLFAVILLPLLQPLIELIIAVFQRLRFLEALSQISIAPPRLPSLQDSIANDNAIVIPPLVGNFITIVVLMALGAGVILLTGIARRERAVSRHLADPESVQLDASNAESAIDQIKRTLNLRRWLAAITVRRLYARMSHEAAKRGQPRAKSQTAYDYLTLLNQAFPAHTPEVRLLTDAYIAAHYGEIPDSPESLANLRAAWDKIRSGRE